MNPNRNFLGGVFPVKLAEVVFPKDLDHWLLQTGASAACVATVQSFRERHAWQTHEQVIRKLKV